MANLVPLHIDKDTGRWVASHAGTGGPNPGEGLGHPVGYVHDQLTPATSWLVVHNAVNDRLICQIYDTAGSLVIPDELNIIDINTIQIEFGSAMDGRAHIMFFNTL